MQNATTSKLYPVVEQIINSTTSWIGQQPGDTAEIRSGQTFVSPANGPLNSIEIFSSVVIRSGKVTLSIHEFDTVKKEWGTRISSSTLDLDKSHSNKWISFPLEGTSLQQGRWYGFILQCPGSLIGIGEAAGTPQQPPNGEGQEWKFAGGDSKGTAFTYFSLAFKVVALRA